MGVLRNGDPDNNPDDVMHLNGRTFILDIIATDPTTAMMRERQIEMSGRHAETTKEYDSPETARQHTDTGIGTTVYKVWKLPNVKKGYRRVKRKSTPKVKGDASQEFVNGVLNVTKAAVIGGIGMGIVGAMGGMLRKKKSNKPKVKKCGCKK
jgi:hypothetical protein